MSSVIQRPVEDPTQSNIDYGQLQQVPIGQAITALRRRKWLIMVTMLIIIVPASLYIFSIPSYYDTSALLMVESRKTEFSSLQATEPTAGGDSLTMRSQTDILTSRNMAGHVVDSLNLIQSPLFKQTLSNEAALRHRILTWVFMQLGVPLEEPRSFTLAQERQVAISWLIDQTTISNDGRSYTISINVRMRDPNLSALIANSYASFYLDFMRNLKVQALARANSLLDQQIVPLQKRVQQADEAVETYREKYDLILNHSSDAQNGTLAGATVADQQIGQINTQLVTAQGNLAEKQSHLRQAQLSLAAGSSGLDAIPEVVASPLIQRLREQQAELAGRSVSLGETALGNNPTKKALDASVADLNRRVSSEVSRIIGSLQAQVSAAQTQVTTLQTSLLKMQHQVTDQSKSQVMLRQLMSEADAARAVYKDYLGRYEQTSSQAALQEPEAVLISAAEPPNGPSGPPRGRLIALTIVASSLLGSFAALAADRLRTGLRTGEHMEQETGLFPLGFVPVAEDRQRIRLERTNSIYTAAVNHVWSMLRFGENRYRAKVVLVTSAAADEGKTFFAISLAASVGRNGGQALLIDADVRNSQVLKSIDGRNRGLPSRRSGSSSTEIIPRITYRTQALPGVDVVTFNVSNMGLAQLLTPLELDALITEARGRYDLIILDTPPVLMMPDAPVMGSVVDGAIMVVQWRHTSVIAVKRALRMLTAYQVRILGGVLTRVRLKDLSSAESGYKHRYAADKRYFM